MIWSVDGLECRYRCSVVSMFCCVDVDVVLCRCSVASMFCCVNFLLCVIDLHGCAWLCVFVRVSVWPCGRPRVFVTPGFEPLIQLSVHLCCNCRIVAFCSVLNQSGD